MPKKTILQLTIDKQQQEIDALKVQMEKKLKPSQM